MVEMDKIKKKKELKIKRKNSFKGKLTQYKENTMVMENELELIKAKMKFVKDVLRSYYLTLLRKGEDNR